MIPAVSLPWMLVWLATAIVPLVLARMAVRRPRLVRWGPSDLLAEAARTSRVTRGGLPWLQVIVRGLVLAAAAAAAARPLWKPPISLSGRLPATVGRQIAAGGDDRRIAIISPSPAAAAAPDAAAQDPTLAIRRGLEALAGTDAVRPTISEIGIRDLPLLAHAPHVLFIVGDQPPLPPADARLLASAVEAGAALLVCIGPQAIGTDDARRRLSAWLEQLAGVTVAGRLPLADSAIETIDELGGGSRASDTSVGFTTLAGPAVTSAADLVVGRPATLLARAAPEGRPLLVEAEHGRGVVCISALPLSLPPPAGAGAVDAWSDLAAWPAFIPFVDRLAARLLAATPPPRPHFAGATAGHAAGRILPLAPLLLAAACLLLLADWRLSAATPREGVARGAMLAILAIMSLAWAGLPARRRPGEFRRPVALLVDRSPSMAGRPGGASTSSSGRLDTVVAAVAGPTDRDGPLERIARDRPLDVFTVAETVARLGGYPRDVTGDMLRSLTPAAPAAAASRIGDGILSLLGDDERPDATPAHPAAILVASDGGITSGASWARAAQAAAGRGVPLVVIPTDAADNRSDASTPPPGFRVTVLRPPRLCHTDEPVAIDVEAEATGPGGPLELRITADSGGPALAAASLACSPSFDAMTARYSGRLTVPPGSFAAGSSLVSPLIVVGAAAPAAADLPPAAVLACPLVATDAPVRVLMVETAPRFEYRFLERLLSRDRGFAVESCMLDPGVAGRSRSTSLPRSKSEWSRFDVVVLGDVSAGTDADARAEAWRGLAAAASEEAVGIAWLPGPRWWSDPDAGLAWLPAVPGGIDTFAAPHRLAATAGGRTGDWLPSMAMAAAAASSPDIFTVLRAATLRPTARVIATVAPPDATGMESVPRAAAFVDRLGAATILVQLCETWRWRRQDGRDYGAFWRRSLRRLAEPHQLARLFVATLTVLPAAPFAGEPVRIEVAPTRADHSLAGRQLEVVSRSSAESEQDPAAPRRFPLPAPGLGGASLVTIGALPAGRHTVTLVAGTTPATGAAPSPPLTLDILVTPPAVETADGLAATGAMRAAAGSTDGAVVEIGAMTTLPDAVSTAIDRASRKATPAADEPAGISSGWLGSPGMANLLMLCLVIGGTAAWWQRSSPHVDGGGS